MPVVAGAVKLYVALVNVFVETVVQVFMSVDDSILYCCPTAPTISLWNWPDAFFLGLSIFKVPLPFPFAGAASKNNPCAVAL